MNLFQEKKPSAIEEIQQVRMWVRQYLSVAEDIPVSISQLQCHEPGCPPIETVISIMSQPVRSLRVHCSVANIEEPHIQALATSLSSP